MRVRFLVEEHGHAPLPGWVVDPEDDRQYEGAVFGCSGTAWATIFTLGLADENRFLKAVSDRFPQLQINADTDLATLMQLRVCSPSFREEDHRFLRDGKQVALVQDVFSSIKVEQYCHEKVRQVASFEGERLYGELGRTFHLFDPDDD